MDAYDFRVLCNASAFSTESMLAAASFSGDVNSNPMKLQMISSRGPIQNERFQANCLEIKSVKLLQGLLIRGHRTRVLHRISFLIEAR